PVGDEDVRRLDITVDRQMPVGECHGLADLPEQVQARVDPQVPVVAPAVDAFAFDPIEREPQASVLQAPAIEQARDVRMHQARQQLAFLSEQVATYRVVALHADHLERDLLLETAFDSFTQIYDCHAATTEFTYRTKRTERCCRHFAIGAVRCKAREHRPEQGAAWNQSIRVDGHGISLNV